MTRENKAVAISAFPMTSPQTVSPVSPVGATALRIDHYVRTAEYLILLDAKDRGRGLAREATLLTSDYGFHITNLRAVWLKVLERNTAGLRAYEGAGFKPVGRLRRAGYWLGMSGVGHPRSRSHPQRGSAWPVRRCRHPDRTR